MSYFDRFRLKLRQYINTKSTIKNQDRFATNKKYNIEVIDTESSVLDNYRDLNDVTFLIPVKIEHPDRERNINLSIDFLQHHFDTNIVVAEESSNPQLEYLKDKCQYYHYSTNSIYTHKTQILNKVTQKTDTEIIVIWDTDALVEKVQILTAYKLIKNKKLDMVYPYEGIFMDFPQSSHPYLINQKYQLSKMSPALFKLNHEDSVGGAIFFNREIFMEGGMMNERFVSYGWEDNELIERFAKLGYRIGRVNGVLVHLEHYRDKNGSKNNLFAINNRQELQKVQMMNQQQLRAYVEECLKVR